MKIINVLQLVIITSIITMAVTVYFQVPIILLALNLVINFVYIITQCLLKNPQQKILTLVIHGEMLTNLLYTLWVFFAQSPQCIYYLPFCLSIIGKIYVIITQKQQRNQTLAESFIILQGKIEFYIIVHVSLVFLLNIVTMNFNLKALIMFISLIVLFRLKYELYYGFQRSINQIHLFYDKLSKKFNLRYTYQKVYKLILKIFFINDYNSGQKNLRY